MFSERSQREDERRGELVFSERSQREDGRRGEYVSV